MTPDEIKAVLDRHGKWLRSEPEGQRAYLRGAYLRGADLGGADLRDIEVAWTSHDLVAEILFRAAGDDLQRRSLAGLVLISRNWCWTQFLAIEHPEREWALGELRKWVKDGDEAPEILRAKKEDA